MPNIVSRKFCAKDEEELNELYNLVAGRSRTILQFEWEWLRTPEGWGSMWLLEDSDTGKIVGHHGLIPIRFACFGSSILAGKTENTVMHPGYRGQGAYYPFEVKFIAEAGDRFDLLYTTAGAGAPGKIRLKLGYAIVGRYAHYMKVTDRRQLCGMARRTINARVDNRLLAALLTVFANLGSLILMLSFARRGPVDRSVRLGRIHKVETVARELDEFWERNKGSFGITVDRNSQYLKWRVFDNPNVNHEFLLARKQGEVVGYVIMKSGGEGPGAIVDLVAAENDATIFNTILDGAVRRFEESGIRAIHFVTLSSGNFLNKVLRRNGFVSASMFQRIISRITGKEEREALLMAKALHDGVDPTRVADPDCWYYTEILGEGIR